MKYYVGSYDVGIVVLSFIKKLRAWRSYDVTLEDKRHAATVMSRMCLIKIKPLTMR